MTFLLCDLGWCVYKSDVPNKWDDNTHTHTQTALSINRVDSRSISSRCWAFRRTHASADPIRLLCIRLALPLTLSLPSRFAPSTRFMVGDTPCTLWLVGDVSYDFMFWEKGGGGLTRQPVGPPVGTATMTTVMSADRMDLGSFSSRCCTFRHTSTSADPIRLLCIRLALPLTLSLPSRQCKTYGWRSTPGLMAGGVFLT